MRSRTILSNSWHTRRWVLGTPGGVSSIRAFLLLQVSATLSALNGLVSADCSVLVNMGTYVALSSSFLCRSGGDLNLLATTMNVHCSVIRCVRIPAGLPLFPCGCTCCGHAEEWVKLWHNRFRAWWDHLGWHYSEPVGVTQPGSLCT